MHVIGNRFGRNSFYDCPILKSTQTTLELTGNVWDDDRHDRADPDARLPPKYAPPPYATDGSQTPTLI